MEGTGVDRAIVAAGGGPVGHKVLADLFGTSVQFIYNAKRKGYFPPDRARQVTDTYGIPLADLVSPANRALLNAQ